jgi:hypothetical protein
LNYFPFGKATKSYLKSTHKKRIILGGLAKKMALLVLRRVGLRVGQNQMCHLCGWQGISKYFVRWEKK